MTFPPESLEDVEDVFRGPAGQPIEDSDTQGHAGEEAVWTYRGYRLRPSEFTTAMVHFFRAEIQRANVWRQRLDTTTNWAVVTTAATLTIAFTSDAHHGVILINTLLITLFLYTEARRYQYYELWSYRVRLLETDFFAAMLVPPFQPAADWAESLAENLLQPHFSISMWEAFGRRYRRNYLWIFMILGLAWLAKVILYSPATTSWSGVLENMAIGSVPGGVVLAAGLILHGCLFMTGLLTQGMHQATGEILPRFGGDQPFHLNQEQAGTAPNDRHAWFRLSRRRQQILALIITDNGQAVSNLILKEMRRGVTSLSGVGMYTGQSHKVLLCALTVTEVNQLKSLVSQIDPKAFVIVTQAQEILGRGFIPLVDKDMRG